MSELNVRELATRLVAEESVTPEDGQCQPLLNEILENSGFTIVDHSLQDSGYTIVNTHAYIEGQAGNDGPSIIFAGHTDVVPVDANWQSDPFVLTEKDGKLFGRGIADMKGGVASMTTAAIKFVASKPDFKGRIGFIFTSFEEVAQDDNLDVNKLGTNHVVQQLIESGQTADYVIVGEPTSSKALGDTLKNGRRGIDDIALEIVGEGGHTAYVLASENPLMLGSVVLAALLRHRWINPEGNFTDTMLNMVRVTGADISATVPKAVIFRGNSRFAPPYTGATISQEIEEVVREALSETLEALGSEDKISYSLRHNISGEPFYTPINSKLVDLMTKAAKLALGVTTRASTAGGTSDGRYLARLSTENKPTHVIEIGHIENTIHQPNEYIPVGDPEKLEEVYRAFLHQIYS